MSKIFDTLTFSWYFSRSIPHLSHSHKSAVKCQKNNSLHQNIVRTLLISMRYLNITIRHFIEIENFISGKRKNQPGAFQFDPYRQKWKRNCNLPRKLEPDTKATTQEETNQLLRRRSRRWLFQNNESPRLLGGKHCRISLASG